MALVIIQIQDNPDGSTSVRAASEPPLVEGSVCTTVAEKLGAITVQNLNNIMANLSSPQIQIVGANELPN